MFKVTNVIFRLILLIPCKISLRHDRPSDTWRSIGQCERPIGHPWSISSFKATFFWL